MRAAANAAHASHGGCILRPDARGSRRAGRNGPAPRRAAFASRRHDRQRHAAGDGQDRCGDARFAPDPTLVALGRRIFDPRLSEPRGMSCAGCHDPPRVRADAVARPLPGVPEGSRPGRFSQRNAPSLLYVRYVPRRHFYQDDDAPAPSPFGGSARWPRGYARRADPRAAVRSERDEQPVAGALLRKIDATELAPDLAARFGAPVRRDPEQLVRALALLSRPICRATRWRRSRRVSMFLRTRKPLAPAEMRGLALFRIPTRATA